MRDLYWMFDLAVVVAGLALAWAYTWFRGAREIEIRVGAEYEPRRITAKL